MYPYASLQHAIALDMGYFGHFNRPTQHCKVLICSFNRTLVQFYTSSSFKLKVKLLS